MATLFVVATPIGNLEDITLRALRVLREVALIAAEDTRRTRLLLKRHGISTPLTSYFEHNKLTKLDTVLAALQRHDVALVSDAGMPGISDPGYELVRAAIRAGFPVVPVPGPSAIVAALAVSGLPTGQFLYIGFLPRSRGERRKRLAEIAAEPRTIVLYEAPHRLVESLADLGEVLGEREIAACRELTKVHEEIVRGSVAAVRAHFEEFAPRGELVLVISGSAGQRAPRPSEPEVQSRLSQLTAEGLTPRRAAAVLAKETGIPARELYRRHHASRGPDKR